MGVNIRRSGRSKSCTRFPLRHAEISGEAALMVSGRSLIVRPRYGEALQLTFRMAE
jgi:hypothetical protein